MRPGTGRRAGEARGSSRAVPPVAVVTAVLLAIGAGQAVATPNPSLPSGPFQTGPTADLTVTPNPAHPGETVTLDARNSSAPNDSIESCEFDVDGDGAYEQTETDCLLEHAYQTVGQYDVTVRVTTTADETDTETVVLDVVENEAPTAAIAVDPTRPDPGETVTLSGVDSTDADGEVVSYTWSLPDGNVTGETVRTSFQTEGEYAVTLTVTDDDGARDSAEETVVVGGNDPPTARLRLETGEPVAGESVVLDAGDSTDPDGTITTYAWDFDGDGRTDRTTAEPRTDFVPETAGGYAVRVAVIDDAGASDTATVQFEVAPAPSPEPTTERTAATPGPTTTAGPGGTDLGLLPLVPDVFGLLVLVVLVVAGAGVGLRRREAVGEKVSRLRDLITRGDIRRKLAQKFSGTAVKTTAKNALRRFSDLIEAAGEAVGEAFERVGQAIKRGSKRVAEWLRQLGA